MKILFLIEELSGGGKERRLVELLKSLVQLPETIEIYLTLSKSNIDYREVENLKINLHVLPASSDLQLIQYYRSNFKTIQPDIIHTWSIKTTVYAAILKPLFNYKIIAGFVSNTFGFSKGWKVIFDKFVFNKLNAVVSNSKTGLVAYGVPKSIAYCIYNGFDFRRLNDVGFSKQILPSLGIETRYNIIMVANVTPKKDYSTFINVAEVITTKRKDVSFISIGKINPELQSLVAPYVENNHPQIKFLGYHANPEKVIQESDIGVLCSDSEGISNAILEYMAAGLPVISTDFKGATKEIVVNDETGFICKKENLLEKIELLLVDETLRRGMGKKGIIRVQEYFSINRMVKKYIDLYKKI